MVADDDRLDTERHDIGAIVMADIAHVLWAANLGCLGFHPWPYRADDPHDTDELRIDLDLSPGVTFPMVQRLPPRCVVARRQRDRLIRQDHRESRTARLRPRRAGMGLVRHTAGRRLGRPGARRRPRPDLITDKWWKEERGARVFIDFNQNAPHKTVFGAWCVRARPGAQVSTPFAWEELPAIHPDDLTVLTVPQRLDGSGDPWHDIETGAQSIAPLVERYELDLARESPMRPGHRCTRRCPTRPAGSIRVAPGTTPITRRVAAAAKTPRPSIAAMSPNDPSPSAATAPWQHTATASPTNPPGGTSPTPGPAWCSTGVRHSVRLPGGSATARRPSSSPRPSRRGRRLHRRSADDRGAVIAAIGCFLPWLTITGTEINGFDEAPGEDASLGPAVIFFVVVLVAMGITTLAAKRILAIAIIGIVAASFSLLISAAQLADYSDFADSELPDTEVGAGLVVVVLGSLIALAGAIVTCAKRRKW